MSLLLEESQQPLSIEAEQAVLGRLIVDGNSTYRVNDKLKPSHFYRKGHEEIYSVILDLNKEGINADLVAVSERLKDKGLLDKVGGRLYITDLALSCGTSANLEYYAERIIQLATARSLVRFCTITASKALESSSEDVPELLAEAARVLSEIESVNTSDDPRPVSAIVPGVYEDLVNQYDSKQLPGLPSGFPAVDDFLNGFQPGDLVTLAARPAMGKTSLALQIGQHLGASDFIALAFSLEMNAKKLVRRMISADSGIEGDALARGTLQDDDWTLLTEVVAELGHSNLYICDATEATVADISSKAKRLKARLGKLDMLIVDYIQLMKGSSQYQKGDPNRTQEVSSITRGLKLLAMLLNVPILALSQLSRAVEMRQNKRPMLSDLRESGSIEQDSDVVMFIYRDDYYNPYTSNKGDAEIIIAKNRNGRIGTAVLRFDAARTRFLNKEAVKIESNSNTRSNRHQEIRHSRNDTRRHFSTGSREREAAAG